MRCKSQDTRVSGLAWAWTIPPLLEAKIQSSLGRGPSSLAPAFGQGAWLSSDDELWECQQVLYKHNWWVWWNVHVLWSALPERSTLDVCIIVVICHHQNPFLDWKKKKKSRREKKTWLVCWVTFSEINKNKWTHCDQVNSTTWILFEISKDKRKMISAKDIYSR